MNRIGRNIIASIQIYTSTMNFIGEVEKVWVDVQCLKGFLDLRSGDSKYSSYDAKIEESTHLFICDYVPLEKGITSENSRMIIDGKVYDIMLIDNPMNLNQHYEIYLKFTGGQIDEQR